MTTFDYCPLPWLGGKRRLLPLLVPELELHTASGRPLVEPFAGGAATTLTVLRNDPDQQARLSDAYRPVCCFWLTVKHDPGFLADRVRRVHSERALWREYRASLDDPDLEAAEAAWRLWATHLWSYGAGGRTYQPLATARAGIAAKVDQVLNAHRLLGRAEVDHLDWREALARDEGVAYLDPPYTMADGKGHYDRTFARRDHEELAGFLRRRQAPWLLSYDDAPLVRRLYGWAAVERVAVNRSLGGRRRAFTELLIRPR